MRRDVTLGIECVKYLAALLMLMFAVHMNWVKGHQYRKQIRVNFAPNFLYVIFTPSIKICQNMNAQRQTEGQI